MVIISTIVTETLKLTLIKDHQPNLVILSSIVTKTLKLSLIKDHKPNLVKKVTRTGKINLTTIVNTRETTKVTIIDRRNDKTMAANNISNVAEEDTTDHKGAVVVVAHILMITNATYPTKIQNTLPKTH